MDLDGRSGEREHISKQQQKSCSITVEERDGGTGCWYLIIGEW